MVYYNLAPLWARRDMAMLGVVHRAAVGKGPLQLRELFPAAVAAGVRSSARVRRHLRAREVLIENSHLEFLERSAFGLVRVYNLLPEPLVLSTSVSRFQAGLQACLKDWAVGGAPSWAKMFSPRLSLDTHPVRHL